MRSELARRRPAERLTGAEVGGTLPALADAAVQHAPLRCPRPVPDAASIQEPTATLLTALRVEGWAGPLVWASSAEAARTREAILQAGEREGRDLLKNPHLTRTWARQLVGNAAALRLVHSLVGNVVGVENCFVLVKHPGSEFEVPVHQDGINGRLELDPQRAVAIWFAVTDATPSSGCLEVLSASHHRGYLAYGAVDDGARGRPLAATIAARGAMEALSLRAGEACALDVRLLHRSGSNREGAPRIGVNVRYVAPGGLAHYSGDGVPLMVFRSAGEGPTIVEREKFNDLITAQE